MHKLKFGEWEKFMRNFFFFRNGSLVLGRIRNVLQPCLLVFPLESDVNMM